MNKYILARGSNSSSGVNLNHYFDVNQVLEVKFVWEFRGCVDKRLEDVQS